MTDAAWLGYTPMSKDVVNHMKNLWAKHELPEEPDFGHWSVEYAREVYEIVTIFAPVGRVDLLRALATTDVWNDDEDTCPHRWTPVGWAG